MNSEIAEQLKQIELAMLKGVTSPEVIKHFAEVQKKFEALVKENAENIVKIEEWKNKTANLQRQNSDLITDKSNLVDELNAEKQRNAANEKALITWGIEKNYAESMIRTLKDLFSAALTKSALKGESFLNFSGTLPNPSNYSSGNISGSGNVKIGTEEVKPEIK